jgi:4-diphosphocytidyl-2-C-methyl-D-erythritol kinase
LPASTGSQKISLVNTPPPAVTISAPAKINLLLAIHGKRGDGYHELTTITARISLADDLLVSRRAAPGVSIDCTDPTIPADATNLAVRGATAVLDAVGDRAGITIRLVKRIPVGAGLGGGSSDAASAMLGTNALLGNPLSLADLARIGASIGSDVPLFFSPGAALCRGRGEQIEATAVLPAWPVRLLCPRLELATARVYAAHDPTLHAPHGIATRLWHSLETSQPPAAWPTLTNQLEPAARRSDSRYDVLVARLRQRLPAITMSGSGSALFVLNDDAPALAPWFQVESSLPVIDQHAVTLQNAIPIPCPIATPTVASAHITTGC